MSRLKAICDFDECGELVDAETVDAHMESHGVYSPHPWRLKHWPDGTAVVLDPELEVPNEPPA